MAFNKPNCRRVDGLLKQVEELIDAGYAKLVAECIRFNDAFANAVHKEVLTCITAQRHVLDCWLLFWFQLQLIAYQIKKVII